jgi:hypothetical protein
VAAVLVLEVQLYLQHSVPVSSSEIGTVVLTCPTYLARLQCVSMTFTLSPAHAYLSYRDGHTCDCGHRKVCV